MLSLLISWSYNSKPIRSMANYWTNKKTPAGNGLLEKVQRYAWPLQW